MSKLNMKKVIERYNDIMISCCREYATIGLSYSEDTDNWNLRDMVAECDYILSTYYEPGHCNCEMRYGDDDEKRTWRSETGRLQRFINRYKEEALKMPCTCYHCSPLDGRMPL